MTQEEKDLLLKDLCARLPYKVIVHLDCMNGRIVTREMGIGSLHDIIFDNVKGKPYLRPLSSMTEEENIEYKNCYQSDDTTTATLLVDFYNKKHLDYRGLIEKGLAIEVTEENNPYKD